MLQQHWCKIDVSARMSVCVIVVRARFPLAILGGKLRRPLSKLQFALQIDAWKRSPEDNN